MTAGMLRFILRKKTAIRHEICPGDVVRRRFGDGDLSARQSRFLYILPMAQFAASDLPAGDAAQAVFGTYGGQIIS